MPEITISFVGDPAAFEPYFAGAGSQKDNLCGAFWGRLAVAAFAGIELRDEEDVALAAGTTVVADDPDPGASLPWRGLGPVTSSGPYRLSLPTGPAARAGTSPAGLARAVTQLSGGTVAAVPVWSPAWDGDLLVALLDTLSRLPEGRVLAVANVAAGHLEASRRPLADVLAALLHGGAPWPSEADWDLGHFISLAGLVRGPAATWVLVRDTYKAFGAAGYGVQRPARVAAALHRDGSGTGGVLLLVPTERIEAVREALGGLAVEECLWDNRSERASDWGPAGSNPEASVASVGEASG